MSHGPAARPLIALTARRLGDGRVRGWHSGGIGEREGYLQRVRAAGGWPVLCDPVPIDAPEAEAFVTRFDGVLLTGGPDVEPERYGEAAHPTVYGTDTFVDHFEMALCRAALATNTPMLAICRGVQVLNVALGGSLWQDIATEPGVEPHGRPGVADGEFLHTVDVAAGSQLAAIMRTRSPVVSCHHHQALRRLGDGLTVTAMAVDGTIEAVEVVDRPVIAVQWHPEDTATTDPANQALFDWLCAPR